MKKKNLSLMCAAMLAATAIPANFAMADETKDAENLTEWAMDEPVTLTVLKNQNPATVNYADGENQYNIAIILELHLIFRFVQVEMSIARR